MPTNKFVWEKVVTREATLLRRYLNMYGYSLGASQVSPRSTNILTVSYDGVSTQYFDSTEVSKAAAAVAFHFSKGTWTELFVSFRQTLESLHSFIQKLKSAETSMVPDLLSEFLALYGRGRGIVYFCHFPELVVSLLKDRLQIRNIPNVDGTITILSAPVSSFSNILDKYLAPHREVSSEQESIFSTFNDETIQQLSHYLQGLSYYHEAAERITTETLVCFIKLLEKLSIESSTPNDELQWYLPEEIVAFTRSKKRLNQSEISSRKKFFVLLMLDGKISLYTDEQGKKLIETELPQEQFAQESQLKGSVVYSSGPIRGKVCIIKKTSEFSKFEAGSILVTPMTTPQFMPILPRAAAIVTDEGGITCHAAIVSRELKIPCIVGTKIATKVFKDGDLVEVDAEKGIVRKL